VSGGGEAGRGALVRVACTAVRSAPAHRAEMVSQWLCGEAVQMLGREEGWVRARGPDGYEGWCLAGALLPAAPGEVEAWSAAADRFSLGARLLGPEEGHAHTAPDAGDAPAPTAAGPVSRFGTPPPRFLPWGARAAAAHDGRVRLPDGRALLPGDPSRLPDPVALRARHPLRGSAVVGTATGWLGTPYLWGGRTPEGADCSGMVQAVYAAHGVPLPRDSGDQLAAGPEAPGAAEDPAGRCPGDLLFFGASRTEVTHVAVCAGGTRIVHVAAARGAASLDDLEELPKGLERLAERLVGVTRPLEVG